MAENYEGFITTSQGLNLLAKAVAGKMLRFSRVGLGDSESGGTIVTIGADDAPDMTNLVHWQKDLPISGNPTVEGGIAYLQFIVQNSDVTNGFWMRETGIFAIDPDTGNEVLYAYENRGTKGGWLPPTSTNEIWEQTFTAAIAVGNVENITAVVGSGLVFVTHDELTNAIQAQVDALQAHIDSTDPHPNLTPATPDAPTEPVDEEQIAAVNSRLSQVETNLANLYLQLSTEKDLGLTPNLMLAEDFTGESVCDMFSQIVMGATQNTRVITLDNGTGLIAGSYYTLTDGVNSEEVQIVSIATNNGVTTVNVASNIQNNYSLANTTLRRSTLTVGDGQAYGAGDIRSETFTFTRVWTGTAANNTATITLATTLANQAAFDLEGDYAFTSDGEFTLAS